MNVRVSINADEIPPNTDPILDLLPLFTNAGYRLTANGIDDNGRFLVFTAKTAEQPFISAPESWMHG